METECNPEQMEFHGLGRRRIVGNFDGGKISSDSGGLLLREVEQRSWILERLAGCFTDHRDPSRTEHSVLHLIKQRVMGLALGYEDLNDHEALRRDPLLALLCDVSDVNGCGRLRSRDQGAALAGKSTLNRLELTPEAGYTASRYRRIEADPAAMDTLLVDLFLDAHAKAPKRIVLDADATDDPLYGTQEGRFFHGYYRHYCYLPLYLFCGEHLLCARLRPANIDGAAGTVDELKRIVERIRTRWQDTQIVLRGDSGFCRDAIMSWCEKTNGVDYLLGLAKNSRLKTILAPAMAEAQQQHETSGEAARAFMDFAYRTRDSWSCARRVIGKAEYLAKGENPRFIVTSLGDGGAQALYEQTYCARGEMENRIKEQQLALFADRTSTHEMRANQLRLYFASFAYVLIQTLRRIGLMGTTMAKARCHTIRLKLFKIGAHIRVSVRRVTIALSDGCPEQVLFAQVLNNLKRRPVRC